jgi:endo-1,4-beta-xylanase
MKIGLARVFCAGFLLSVPVSQSGNGSKPVAEVDHQTRYETVTTVISTPEEMSDNMQKEPRPLRALVGTNGPYIGTAVNVVPLRNVALYRETLAREFNMVVAENVMKMGPLRPSRESFAFKEADELMEFAEANQMLARGHTLVWHNQQPTWLQAGKYNREQLLEILHEHIKTVVGRYKGRISAWDVVNEAVADNGTMRKSIWLDTIGPDYLDYAFIWAREADPTAKLFYNDYGGEGLGTKSNAIYKLVQKLKAQNIPIDGVGLQMHISIGRPLNPTLVAKNIKRLNDLGLEVQITEMDVQIQDGVGTTEERYEAQAKVYREITEVCLKADRCTAILTWGFTDQYTWIPGFTGKPDAPLLFDKKYAPKPAYDALVNLLGNQQ